MIPVGTTSARGQTKAPAYLGAQASEIPIVATPTRPESAADPQGPARSDPGGRHHRIAQLARRGWPRSRRRYWSPSTPKGWEKYFKAVADVLGKPGEYTQVTGEITTEIGKVKQQVTTKGERPCPTASIVRWAADGPTIVGGNSMSSWVLTQVGFTRPAAQEKINSQGRSGDKVSLENLDLIDADYLFFGAGRQGEGRRELSAARKLPVSARSAPTVRATCFRRRRAVDQRFRSARRQVRTGRGCRRGRVTSHVSHRDGDSANRPLQLS